jgi:3-dehydroquinate dehydratase-1
MLPFMKQAAPTSAVRFGSLSVGPVPRVVGTITMPETLATAGAGGDRPCDIVEIRLDKLGGNAPEWLMKAKAIEARGFPVLCTVRLAAEGGDWRRPDEERTGLFAMALEHLSAVDVEFQSRLLAKVANMARAARKPLIVSAHDFVKTPPLRALQNLVLEAGRYASVVKVTTMITRPADVRTLRELLEQDCGVPLCVMGMGPAGTETRTLFPTLGSCLTYGYLDASAAPGQVAASELVEKLSLLFPSYRQDRARRV